MAVKGYDYIIVGADTAGCVQTNRLSEDSGIRVLLLEAGPHHGHPLIHIPPGMGKMHDRLMFDRGYRTEPEPTSIEAMRGKVPGGCSARSRPASAGTPSADDY